MFFHCNYCDQDLPVEQRSGSNGRNRCKACWAQRMREYNAANGERIRARARERYKSPDSAVKAWARRNPELVRERDRRHHYLKKYGLTPEEADDLKAAGCAICRGFSKQMNIDHNHTTGEVRGALCNPCNQALGLLKEDMKIMQSMIDYIERFGS